MLPEPKQAKNPSKKILFTLMITAIFLLGIHILLQYLNTVVFQGENLAVFELSNRFDFDDESSIPTWYSQALWFVVFLSAALCAYMSKAQSLRRLWAILAGLSLFFSIDEVSAIHENILQFAHLIAYGDSEASALKNAWLLALPIFLIFAGIILYYAFRLLPRRTVMLFISSAAIFVSGAIFVDIFVSSSDLDTFLAEGILVGLEEFAELAGITVFLYAITDYAFVRQGKSIRNAIQALRD